MYIYKKDLDTSEHIREQFNQLFKSESLCNQMIGTYIARKIEAGGFIRDDVLDYVVSHDFGNDYADLIYKFFDYLKDLSPYWLEILLDIIKNKEEQDVSSFLSEVYGAFVSGIPLDKVKLCYENAEDPHAFAVALENNSSDGAYSKMLESLSAITNVIEKIEFDRSNQTEEFGYMSDSIAGLKEQLKEKADTIKNRDEQIEHLNELLNSKADITQEELNKIIKYRDFYERKYNAAMDELDEVKDKNCKYELKILELEKRIKEIPENTDNMDSKEQPTVNNDFVEKLNLITEKVSKLDEIFTVIGSFQSKFDNVHKEIKLLDDSNSSILNTEMTKLTNNFNNIIDDRLEVVLKQLTKLVVAEFLVVNSVDLISAFFKLPQALCNVMVGNAQFNINTSDAVYRCLESPSFSDATILWLFSLVLMVLTAISGGSIIYLAIIRIFKVLMIIPYAAIATSTVASSHGIASTTISYYKYAFATILESATMLIAVNLSGYLITNNSDLLTTLINGSDFNEALSWMIGTMMLLACTMGAVKEAGQITHRVLGT